MARFMGRQNTIPVPVPFIDLVGDMTAAAFLSQCLYWGSRTTDPDGWFFKTQADWYEELRLSPDQIRRCTKTCEAFIEAKRGGVTGKMHFRVLHEPLEAALQMLGNPITSYGETQQLDVGKPNNQLSGNPTSSSRETQQHSIYTKTTAEITAEKSAAAAAETKKGANQIGADRAADPSGSGQEQADSSHGQTQTASDRDGQGHQQEELSGGGRAGEITLRRLMGPKLYEDCVAEDDDRVAWGDLSVSRIADLKLAAKAEAKEKNLPKWRTPFIALLDKEIQPKVTPRPASTSVEDLVRARLKGSSS